VVPACLRAFGTVQAETVEISFRGTTKSPKGMFLSIHPSALYPTCGVCRYFVVPSSRAEPRRIFNRICRMDRMSGRNYAY
jgi:hypothetical protein